MTTANLTLVGHHLCPYVQRACIALVEKSVVFERRYVDLKHKTDWFRAISPLGKVPLLLVERGEGPAVAIFESNVICEYMEETEPEPRLHPRHPLDRARHRAWMEFGSSILADLWGFETARDAATFEVKRTALIDKFTRVEAELHSGPFFARERFSLVDAVFAPIFRYFEVFDRLAPTAILGPLPRVSAWRAALAARPSVQNAVDPDYAERLQAFLVEQGSWLLRQRA